MKLRVGRKLGRTLYQVIDDNDPDYDVVCGMLDNAAVAKQLVKDSALADFVRELWSTEKTVQGIYTRLDAFIKSQAKP